MSLTFRLKSLELLRRGGKLIKKFLLFNTSWCVFHLISISYLLNLNLWRSVRDSCLVLRDEFKSGWLTHRVISDNVHRLFDTLSYFWPDRFAQLLILIPILIFLIFILASIDLVYTEFARFEIKNYSEEEQLLALLIISVLAETIKNSSLHYEAKLCIG